MEVDNPEERARAGLTSPHADEVLVLADGRLLAWAEWGDPRGSPLVFLHPSPGSRVCCPDLALTARAGIRLITVDRPGYGRSDPVAEPTLAGFARDLERLLDHLWIGEIQVVGWSAGGLYAAACAALLAERVMAVALVATPAPDRQLRWLTPPLRKVAELAQEDPYRALAAAAELAAPLAGTPDRAGAGWVTSEHINQIEPAFQAALATMWREAFRAGTGGVAADLIAGARPWGFAPTEVRARTNLFYAVDDPLIGAAHARWWARALPEAHLTLRRDGGAALPFVAWPDILRAGVESPRTPPSEGV